MELPNKNKTIIINKETMMDVLSNVTMEIVQEEIEADVNTSACIQTMLSSSVFSAKLLSKLFDNDNTEEEN